MTEAARAAQYRRDQQAIEDARYAREKALHGDPAAKRALEAAWEPLTRWDGWDPNVRISEESAEERHRRLSARLGVD